MVGTAGADDPLEVVGPADVGNVRRVANVLLEFGTWFRGAEPDKPVAAFPLRFFFREINLDVLKFFFYNNSDMQGFPYNGVKCTSRSSCKTLSR